MEKLKLENLPAFNGQRCLKFYYYAHHTDVTTNYGDLTVYERPHGSTDPSNQKQILFIDNKASPEWTRVLYNLDVGQSQAYDVSYIKQLILNSFWCD